MKSLLFTLGLCLAAIQSALCAPNIALNDTGLQIIGDSELLKFEVLYPVLVCTDDKKIYKVSHADVAGNLVTLKYEGGGQIELSLDASGLLVLKGSTMPDDVKAVRLMMSVPLDLRNGGTYQLGDAKPVPFPVEQAPKPHMFQGQGHPATFSVRTDDGKGIRFTLPQYGYQEVNDLRQWGTQNFAWMTLSTYNETLTYKIEDAPAPPAADASTNAAPTAPKP